MAISASQLRQNIYQLLDEVLETGVPLEIERRGRTLRIVPAGVGSKLGRVVGRQDFIVGDPDEVVHVDWSEYWRP